MRQIYGYKLQFRPLAFSTKFLCHLFYLINCNRVLEAIRLIVGLLLLSAEGIITYQIRLKAY